MQLLAVLMSLCIERLVNPGLFLHRFAWFPAYLNYLQTKLPRSLMEHKFLGLAIISLPILIVAALVYYLLGGLANDMVKELIGIIILIYCLGPGDNRRQLEGFIGAIKEQDIERANDYLDFLPTGVACRERAVSERAILSFNEEIFTVLFWYSLLGPLGALFYRVSGLTGQYAQTEFANLYAANHALKGILEWLPIRLLGLSFTLVGNFTASFHFWVGKIISSYEYNHDFLQTIGLYAVGADLNDPSLATIEENKALLGLFDRSLIIWLVALALFNLGALAY